jgi:hypothetical protein
MMPVKPTKKHADKRLLSKRIDVAKKKSRPHRRLIAALRRRHLERQKRTRGDGAPRRRSVNDPNKRRSGGRTKSPAGRLLNGPGKRQRQRLLR